MRTVAVVHTRPDSLIQELARHSLNGVGCSLLDIKAVPFEIDGPCDAVLLTSAHAIPAALSQGVPIITPWQETAYKARVAGLEVVSGLECKHIVHLTGRRSAPGTKRFIEAFKARSVTVYETQAKKQMAEEIVSALNSKELEAVLMFSEQAAQVFTELAKESTNVDLWRHVRGVAFSPRIALAMEGLPWLSLTASAHPNRNSILEALNNV